MQSYVLRMFILFSWIWPIPNLSAKNSKGPSALTPQLKRTALARTDRNQGAITKRSLEYSNSKQKSPLLNYASYLPFGMGQFARDKTILGGGFAATQAGFLLIYLDRLQQIKSANRDVYDVMAANDADSARNSPTILSFLDKNESFVKKSTRDSQIALLGFGVSYGLSVAEAFYDPFRSKKSVPRKKRIPSGERREDFAKVYDSRLGMIQAEPNSSAIERSPKTFGNNFGLIYLPASSNKAELFGLSLQKSL